MPNPDNDHNPHVLAARIRELQDREHLKELKAQYARRSDAVFNAPGAASAIALADLFTDDGVLDLGPYGKFEGRAALLNAFENLLPQGTQWSTHYVANPLISVTGDTATGSWYYLIRTLPAGPDAVVIPLSGSYDDTYVRTPDGWKIKQTISGFFIPPG
ncbi:nuclear transport factor 2 family protein [Enhygromyxa salina]|uniref:SnoaL-like domain-containing protein n=1 Tax=Enhygromyxa salina TaxID=215803 RepID=A0A2S9YLL6_9BACT|nr:nuclear transport factor 2 family protein [Enhygromyxa salina]PRQ05983.1 hypothetical protein ENSA7_42450 [Enhygromyxa salina]